MHILVFCGRIRTWALFGSLVHGFTDGCAHLTPLACPPVLLALVWVQRTQEPQDPYHLATDPSRLLRLQEVEENVQQVRILVVRLHYIPG